MSKELTTVEIEWAVARMYGIRANLIIPNVHQGFYLHECDLLIVRPSGYLVEIEIKRTKADLLADFKKPHRSEARETKQIRIKELYYAIPEKLLEIAKTTVPKRHGLIVIRRHGFTYTANGYPYATIIRRAKPKPGARPISNKEYRELARLGCLRVWDLKRKLVILKNWRKC